MFYITPHEKPSKAAPIGRERSDVDNYGLNFYREEGPTGAISGSLRYDADRDEKVALPQNHHTPHKGY